MKRIVVRRSHFENKVVMVGWLVGWLVGWFCFL